MIQLSTGKQYSGDSYFRGQDFIQTNLHGTLPRILMPVSVTLASQEFTQAFPKPRSLCQGSQPMRGAQLSSGKFLTATISAGPVSGFTSNTQWSLGEGASSQATAASTSEPWDRP
jgi:hypothetical protein